MKPVPLRAYMTLKKSDLSYDDALRLVRIIKKAPEGEGVAIFKSLAWSIDRALKRRRQNKS